MKRRVGLSPLIGDSENRLVNEVEGEDGEHRADGEVGVGVADEPIASGERDGVVIERGAS